MTFAPPRFDRALFAKCQALAERGATLGEREAGRAAATRVAASAGLALGEALRLMGEHPDPSPRFTERSSNARSARAARPAYAWRTPKVEPEPVTVAEMMAQKAADVVWRKKAAARQTREDRRIYAEQEARHATLREQQAAVDQEWAEARAHRDG